MLFRSDKAFAVQYREDVTSKRLGIPLLPTDNAQHTMPMITRTGQKFELSYETYLPPGINATGKRGTVFFVPGTAYIGREAEATMVIASRVAHASGLQVIVLKHRDAPEHKFPAAFDDVFQMMDNFLDPDKPFKKKHAIDLNFFGLLGYSSGATIMLATLLHLLSKKRPAPKEVVLVSPWFIGAEGAYEYRVDPTFGAQKIKNVMSCTFQDVEKERIDPRVSPVNLTDEQIHALPQIRIVVGSDDAFLGAVHLFMDRVFAVRKSHDVVNLTIEPGRNHSMLWVDAGVMKRVGQRFERSEEVPAIQVFIFTVASCEIKFVAEEDEIGRAHV